MSDSSFDPRDFRRALGQFPTGVTVITTLDDKGEPVGCTASSFNSVSMDPPLILWSVDKGALGAPIFKNASHFAVNVLGKDQVALSNKFAGRGEDKFSGVLYEKGEGGAPLLENCAAQFECKNWNVYDGGDHHILVGEVIKYRHGESISPLVFASGSYAVSMQHPSSMKRDELELNTEGFLADYVPYLLRVAVSHSSSQLYPQLMAQCGVTPEEWRVFTLLADNGPLGEADLAHMVMQPDELFKGTAKHLLDKGYIVEDGTHTFSLTPSGEDMSVKLFSIAKSHEEHILKSLTDEACNILKSSLRLISGTEKTN